MTITNKKESDHVFQLLVQAGVTRAWIGLTSESPINKTGIWKWQAGDHVKDDFSYWYSGNYSSTSVCYLIVKMSASV